jgi:CDP-diacylglycerol pyrophosphatase
MAPRVPASTIMVVLLALAVAAALPPVAMAICTSGNPHDGNHSNTDDVVTSWDLACDAGGNAKCNACTLWALAKRDAGKSASYSATKAYRAKIMPTVPLAGLESIVSPNPTAADRATYFLWSQALDAAVAGTLPTVKNGRQSHPIAYVNSLSARTMHHLHIHVGTPTGDAFYQCARDIIRTPPSQGKWTDIKAGTSAACNALSMNKSPVAVSATTARPAGINQAIRNGFQRMGGSILADWDPLHTGVLVQKASSGDSYLVFLITGARVNDYTVFEDSH